MPKFRRKALEVEAVQFTGSNWDEMKAFTGKRNVEDEAHPYLVDVFNPIGTYMIADLCPGFFAELWVEYSKPHHQPIRIGEWVVKDGITFYPVQEDDFAATYDPMEEL